MIISIRYDRYPSPPRSCTQHPALNEPFPPSLAQMNADSSRSHTIFRIVIESREIPDESAADEQSSRGAVRVATLNLVDLAGSERVSQTKATGERLKEGGAINRSLLYLAEVIHKLSEKQCVLIVIAHSAYQCLIVATSFHFISYSILLRIRVLAQRRSTHPVPKFQAHSYLTAGARWKLTDHDYLHRHAC